jgi:hypothetical protein
MNDLIVYAGVGILLVGLARNAKTLLMNPLRNFINSRWPLLLSE